MKIGASLDAMDEEENEREKQSGVALGQEKSD
jgi:hypothetical protein